MEVIATLGHPKFDTMFSSNPAEISALEAVCLVCILGPPPLIIILNIVKVELCGESNMF